ncbi:viral protein 7 [Wellfleet Bay virus]|uniref:Viral protein 7 n=1 Tax=Wellfleet Bay virus TaxID=1566309 RepID=A0A0A1E6X7_9ORTO|nr:viral protein 7 [Wellfleet Bay virus]AIY25035.1 viral protein 7 [Wellfleet Bay virus]
MDPNPTGSRRENFRCSTLNWAQSMHQIMALSGDLLRLLEGRRTDRVVELRARIGAFRDAMFTDLINMNKCRPAREMLVNASNGIVEMMVDSVCPVGSSSVDPMQAVLIKLAQVAEETRSIPLCCDCCR